MTETNGSEEAIVGSAEPLTPEERRVRLQELQDWGVDLSLTSASLFRIPTDRITRMLSALAFARELRRGYLKSVGSSFTSLNSYYGDSLVPISPAPLLEHLLLEKVRAVVIGGFAAVSLGVPYLTRDLDLCYDPAPENAGRLVRALAPLHPRLRVGGMTEQDARALPFRWDEHTLQQAAILTLQTDVIDLDIMSAVPGVGSYADVHAAAVEVEVLSYHLLVLDLPALIASKRAAGRPKDLRMLPEIEATLRLREQQEQSR